MQSRKRNLQPHSTSCQEKGCQSFGRTEKGDIIEPIPKDEPTPYYYKAGADNPADYLSRHPLEKHAAKQGRMAETYINFIADNSVPKAMTLVEIEQASNADKEIREVRACIKLNQWNVDAEAFQRLS